MTFTINKTIQCGLFEDLVELRTNVYFQGDDIYLDLECLSCHHDTINYKYSKFSFKKNMIQFLCVTSFPKMADYFKIQNLGLRLGFVMEHKSAPVLFTYVFKKPCIG